ncbi:TIR domain-containing protein [Nostoc sp. LPT]|uniref:TIR domain-containing protein n=1 Tax=Nostoc sp. LPT TaxID=2815387 RepID=UPI001DB1AD48|nr:TIR domain-containing protein [Nostoc sp. LPT]MBN4003468.1 TIR domain-containing protein [Nostoc sp. LPT]
MQVFMSYSSSDKDFVRRLKGNLKSEDIEVWLDEDEIIPGDSILAKLEKALFNASVFVLVLSPDSIDSEWVKREREAWINLQIDEEKRAKVESRDPNRRLIPVLYKDCKKPLFLESILHIPIDNENYQDGLKKLIKAIGRESNRPPVEDENNVRSTPQQKSLLEDDIIGGKLVLNLFQSLSSNDQEKLISLCSGKQIELPNNQEKEPFEELLELIKIARQNPNSENSIVKLLNTIMELKIISNIGNLIQELKTGRLNFLKGKLFFHGAKNDSSNNSNFYNINEIKNLLLNGFEGEENLTDRMSKLLVNSDKGELSKKDNYAAGNILNFLLKLDLKKDFSYFDLSSITILEADLREAILTGVDFSNSDLKNSIFSEPLGCIHSIAFNADGSYFATGDAHGSIRVHNTENLELCYFQNERGSQIWSVAFSSETEPWRFAWGAEDGSVRLFEIETDTLGKLKLSNIDLPNEQGSVLSKGRVLSVAFSPSGNILAFGGDGKGDAIKFFDILEKKKLPSLSATNISCMTFINDNLLVSGGKDGDIYIWYFNTRKEAVNKRVHTGVIRCIAFNSQQNIIASGGEDGKVILSNYLNLNGEGSLTELQFPTENENIISQIRTLAFSQDGKILAVGCIDRNLKGQSEHRIRLWKLIGKEWNFIDNLEGHEHLIRSVTFCPNPTNEPKLLISGGDGRTVKLWHWENENDKWKCKQTLTGYANRVWSVAFSKEKDKDGKDRITFACGGEDNTIRIWNYHDRSDIPIHKLLKHTDWVWSVAFNKDGTLIASGGEDNKIFLWQLQDEKWESIELIVNKDNELTEQGNKDNALTEQGNNKLTGHSKRVRCVVFHADSNILASAGNDNKVVLWNLDDNIKSPQILKEFIEHKDRVLSLAFSPNGDYLASSDRETKIYLRKVEVKVKSDGTKTVNVNSYETPNVNSDDKEKDINDHKDQVHSIAFGPKENTLLENKLVSGGFDQQLKLWDVDSGELIHKLTWSGDQKILSVAIHPEKPMIASAGHGGFITLWKISEADKKWESKPHKTLKGHKLAVESVVFSPDGKRLISCSQDQTIKFWDVEGDINISINTIELGKLYQGMNISGVKGLDEAQIDALEELGASRDRKISGVSNEISLNN